MHKLDEIVSRVWYIHAPCLPQVLRAHQNHFCPRVRREDQGVQNDDHETRTGIPLPKPCIIIRDYGKLGFGGITPIILRSRTNSLVSLYAVMCDYLRLFQYYWPYSNYSYYVISPIQYNWNNRIKLKRFIIDFQAFWSIK